MEQNQPMEQTTSITQQAAKKPPGRPKKVPNPPMEQTTEAVLICQPQHRTANAEKALEFETVRRSNRHK